MIWYVAFEYSRGWFVISRAAWGMLEDRENYARLEEDFTDKTKADHLVIEMNMRREV